LTLARLAGHATLYPTVIMFPGHLHIPRSTTLFGHSALHLDKDVVTSESLERSPLAEYAAEYWADHARSDNVSQNVVQEICGWDETTI
jgi:hypothetical protein